MLERQAIQRPRRRETVEPAALTWKPLVPTSVPDSLTSGTTQRVPSPGFDFARISIRPPQPQVDAAGGDVPADLARRIEQEQGGGAALDGATRARMEARFGHRFEDVRIHADDEADTLNRALDARAFTLGRDVFFSQEATSTGPDNREQVLAHELTHVVQQRGTAPSGPLSVGPVDAPSEQQATTIARAISDGSGQHSARPRPVAPALVGHAQIQRQVFRPRSLRSRAPSQKSQLSSLAQEVAELKAREQERDRQVAILNKKQAATSLDLEWRARFGERLASYRGAIFRITEGMDNATRGFNQAHEEQALADQLMVQFVGGFLAFGFAAGFEWAFSAALGKLGSSARFGQSEITNRASRTPVRIVSSGGRLKNVAAANVEAREAARRADVAGTVEAVENPANVAVGAGVNIAGTMSQATSRQEGKTPDLGGVKAGKLDLGGGSPVVVLSRNSQLLLKHEQEFEQAFVTRAEDLKKLTDAEWEQFDVSQQEATYKTLLNNLNEVASGVEEMAEVGVVANVIEKHLWASWLKRQHSGFLTAGSKVFHQDYAALEKEAPYALSGVGWELVKRMHAIGVTAEAGIRDLHHLTSLVIWEQDEFHQKLMVWATTYRGSITKTEGLPP
jgi:hypothetical protein